MSDPTADPSLVTALPVRVEGIVRGAGLSGVVGVAVAADRVTLFPAPHDRARGIEHTVPIAALDGVRAELAPGTARLALFVRGSDVVELSAVDADATALADAAIALHERAFALPEVTRALRAFGSRRAAPGSDHDRFFAPLVGRLTAARGCAVAHDSPGALTRDAGAAASRACVAAVDARSAADELRTVLAALARERHPSSAPDRRALEAELLDLADDTFSALDALAAAAVALRDAPDDVRVARWRAWADVLTRAFASADRCWLAALPALADSRGGGGRFWRRVLRRGRRGAVILVIAGAGSGANAGRAGAQPVGAPLFVVRVAGADSLDAAALARRGFDVVPGRAGERLVVVTPAERARLEALGAATSVVRAPGGVQADRAPGAAPVPLQTRVYRSFDDPQRGVRAFLDSLARANPRVTLDTLGQTVQGRPILAAKFGGRDDAPSRPNVLFLATYHAREWAATEVALRLARYLASPPTPSARLDSLIARRDVWIVPVANPDGYQYTFGDQTQRLWRKNRRVVPGAPLGAVGVDLNRNHSTRWGLDDDGSSPDPSSEIYRGPSAASEAEVAAVERFHAVHPPVVSVSYHSYAGLLLYPPGYRYGILSGDLGIYRTLAGTDERPAVLDRLPGAMYGYQRPVPSWTLYPTNGDYNDFAAERYGTISFTPELTSGYEDLSYYGFEFPDDETRLQRLFDDNLPFALDAIESAADPLRYASPTTGLVTPRVALESVSPRVRVRVPASAASTAVVRVDGATRAHGVDVEGGGRYQRRVVVEGTTRPREVGLVAGADSARWQPLVVGGAEAADSAWRVTGFAVAPSAGVAGSAAWRTSGGVAGTIRSPEVRVPAGVDTVTVSLWTRYGGDGFSPVPQGTVSLSRDGGRTFERVLTVAGTAFDYYPESRAVGGVSGATLQLQLETRSLPWIVDEIALVAHLPRGAGADTARIAFRPSENPVRGDAVRFTWPHAARAGELLVYDYAGRLVWRTSVDADAADVTWRVADVAGLANGVYLVLARAGGDVRRQTLYVLRAAR